MPQLDSGSGCTIEKCGLDSATIRYIPSLPGNTLFLAIFSLLLITHFFQTYRYRTWSYSIAMIFGLVLEVVGYVGRVQMHYDIWNGDYFLLRNIITLTIAPFFFTASLYLTLSRIILHFSPTQTLSRFSPRTISLTFMTCDVIALILQAIGGGIANESENVEGRDKGTHVMVAGLVFQVVGLILFVGVASEFAWSVRRERMFVKGLEKGSGSGNWNGGKGVCGEGFRSRTSLGFRLVFVGMTLATILILTRSIFRVVELWYGFTSKVANNEVTFMVLEGALVVLATLLMTVFHPGKVFGEKWSDAGWRFGRNGKKHLGEFEGGHHDSPPLVLLK